MITIVGIGDYDESEPFLEQPDEAVSAYLAEKINEFNDLTALTFDAFNRPLTFQYQGNYIVIDSERTYRDDSVNYFIESQSYSLKKV